MSKIAHKQPALLDVGYKCPICGMQAKMVKFYGGPAYAHHWHYAIECSLPTCPNGSVAMEDWKDGPLDAIRAWNRKDGR